ncbi:aminotransferase class I/II-fold pyridoxal phosphate-dependent enzyme [Chloroflexota bacterium]
MNTLANRVKNVGPSVFAEINMLARQHQAVNIGQGAPDFDGPPEVMAAAVAALESGQTAQYARSLGTPSLCQAIADHAQQHYGQTVNPETEVLIVGGASLGIYFVLMGLVNPGDEVIVFEPYFDTYVPNIEMADAIPRYVPLRPPDWSFDLDELAAAFNDRTCAILVNTPHNPTGKVFSPAELAFIAELCQKWDVVAITDEVYEHLLYDDARHIRLATLPGMAERTITISSSGKTFSITGFKIGWCIGPAPLLDGAKRIHEFSMFAVAHPLQEAVAVALQYPQTFYDDLRAFYHPRRDMMVRVLREVGFAVVLPDQLGAFYLMADFSNLFPGDDMAFARYLILEHGVACIPASPFFSPANKNIGRKMVRLTFCKKEETLQRAERQLSGLRQQRGL